MNVLTLFGQLPQPAIIALIASVIIPGFSAAVVKEHWDASITGILTIALSTADGFFTEWAKDGSDFNWKLGVGIAIGSWIIAAITQSKVLSGTQFEAWLLSLGSRLKFDLADRHPDDDTPTDPTLSLAPEDQTEEPKDSAGQVAADSQIAAPPTTT